MLSDGFCNGGKANIPYFGVYLLSFSKRLQPAVMPASFATNQGVACSNHAGCTEIQKRQPSGLPIFYFAPQGLRSQV